MSPDTTVKTAGHVAMGANSILNSASTLINGTSSISGTASQMFHRFGYGEEKQKNQFIEKIQEEYIDEETGILNREGRRYLNRLYGNNEEFRDEIIIFVRDKMELDLKEILDRRYKTKTLNKTGKKYLTECVASKDYTKDVIEILAKYVGYS